MTFVPIITPPDVAHITSEPCWGAGDGGYGRCTHMACTSLGLCSAHLDEYREASRDNPD